MSTATRTAGPTGPALRARTGAVAVDSPAPPVVVLDLTRVLQRFGELRAALPWMDVRYDVCALAHPELISAVAGDGAGFVISHDAALPALRRSGVDLSRALHAAAVARWPRRRAAWESGVRLFVLDDPRDLDDFVGAPDGTALLLRLGPEHAAETARRASALGLRVAGLSVRRPPATGPDALLDAVGDTVALRARIAASTGLPLGLLDLGDALSGPMAGRPEHIATLGRSLRSIIAPATSRTAVVASAGQTVAADAITIVAGAKERYADAAAASACIDAGAEVVVVRRRNRLLRPARTRSTWTPAG